jgi:hypothetical protein
MIFCADPDRPPDRDSHDGPNPSPNLGADHLAIPEPVVITVAASVRAADRHSFVPTDTGTDP